MEIYNIIFDYLHIEVNVKFIWIVCFLFSYLSIDTKILLYNMLSISGTN